MLALEGDNMEKRGLMYALVLSRQESIFLYQSKVETTEEEFVDELRNRELQLVSKISRVEVLHVKERVQYLEDIIEDNGQVWQYASKRNPDVWREMTSNPIWSSHTIYRRKPVVERIFWTVIVEEPESGLWKSMIREVVDASYTKEEWRAHLRYYGYVIVSEIREEKVEC